MEEVKRDVQLALRRELKVVRSVILKVNADIEEKLETINASSL